MSFASGFLGHFSVVPDPRIDRAKRHELIDILFIGVCTVICGGEGFTDMEVFGKAKEEWLRKYLELPHGIPSHDTFRRVFAVIEPTAFAECFSTWSESLHEATKGGVVALDGKTLRHSFDTASRQPALHMISAWATENGVALGHLKVEPETNEITALPRLLETLDIEGRTVTMDAMGCQKELAEKIVEKKGDYVLCVKGNQASLHEDVAWFFDECEDFADVEHTYYESVEKDHGRIEIRKCWAVEGEAEWLGFGEKWKGLRSIAAVKAERIIGTEKSTQTRYYISSLPGDAKRIADAVREHWAIENGLHWVLDVTLGEDRSRIRKDSAPENLATLRRIAVNMIRKGKGKSSIRQAIMKAGWDTAFLERLLTS
jgi:predicted transposase YbfD/YdcC